MINLISLLKLLSIILFQCNDKYHFGDISISFFFKSFTYVVWFNVDYMEGID